MPCSFETAGLHLFNHERHAPRRLFRYSFSLAETPGATGDDGTDQSTETCCHGGKIMTTMSNLILGLLALGFAYSLLVSWLAYRQSGEAWMLFLPQWIFATSGVTRPLRRHGCVAFALLFVAVAMLYIDLY
jgi:hypothetical protein